MFIPDSRSEDERVENLELFAEHAEVVLIGRTDVLQGSMADCGNEGLEILASQGETHRRRGVKMSDDGLEQLVTK